MIDLFSKELAFGLTPFETLYAYNGEVYFIDEHYKRLKRSLYILGIKNNLTFEDFKREVYESIKEIHSQIVIKVIYIDDKLHIKLRTPSYNKEMYDRGLRIIISRTRKSRSILNCVKTFNYGQNYIEDLRAKNKGYDSCMFLNSNGYISEAAYGNLFFVKEGTVYTPDFNSSVLLGIMRKNVIKFLKSKGVKVIKTNISVDELNTFDEAFFTNVVAGAFPILQIDKFTYNNREVIKIMQEGKLFKRPWN